MDAYGISIHGKRIDRIGEIHGNLIQKGISVDEDTLRKWLQIAALHIDPPPKE
jgi:hypothetical protein